MSTRLKRESFFSILKTQNYPPSSTQKLQGLTELDFSLGDDSWDGWLVVITGNPFILQLLWTEIWRTRWLIKNDDFTYDKQNNNGNIPNIQLISNIKKKTTKKTHTLHTLHWMVFAENAESRLFRFALTRLASRWTLYGHSPEFTGETRHRSEWNIHVKIYNSMINVLKTYILPEVLLSIFVFSFSSVFCLKSVFLTMFSTMKSGKNMEKTCSCSFAATNCEV